MNCIRCRCSLVGLPEGGVCPECGFPIMGPQGHQPRPRLRESAAGRVYLGVVAGATIQIGTGIAAADGPRTFDASTSRGPSVQHVLVLGGVYSLAFAALAACLWCMFLPEIRIPKAALPVAGVALIAAALTFIATLSLSSP